jgi:osmotically inducible lipoprotein OsmB
MRITLAVVALALLLSGCETARQDRQLGGALIGGAAGGLIGGAASNSVGGALVGGVVGAGVGAIIADETRPRGRCYRRTASGRLVRARC